jgi:MSHA biogenesis protein MshM
MYLEFFGLHKPPFRITPDTHAFFEGSDRGAILTALCYAISHGEGIIKLVGEVGSGKTMLCRMLPLKLTDNIDWVYLAHPSLSPEHTLHAIAQEMGLSVADQADKLSVMRLLHETLLERHIQGRQVVVLVEEAQGIPLETLEEIRLLSNLETNDHKLLQIVLFGQPELDDNLATPSIRQLRERITHSLYLTPLALADIQAYLNFRLRAVGYTGPDLFSYQVARAIADYSQGLVRRINILADKTLLFAYTQDRHTLTLNDIRQAAKDNDFKPSRPKHKWIALAGLVACLMAVTFFIGTKFESATKAQPVAVELMK